MYLIHFDRPLAHARHYIGFCEEGKLERRMERHRKGQGAKLLRAATAAGIAWSPVRVWLDADREFERLLKSKKGPARFCPCCRPATWRASSLRMNIPAAQGETL